MQEDLESFKSKMSAQSDEFIRDIYQLVFWPVIERKVLPMINVVVSEAITGLSPKDKITKVQLLAKMN